MSRSLRLGLVYCMLIFGMAMAADAPSTEAVDLTRRSLVFDGHNDLPWRVRKEFQGDWRRCDLAQPQVKLQTDIPRLRAGALGAVFWSAYVPADTDLAGTALRDTLEQIDLIHQMIARWPETFELALSADDVERIRASGKIASLIGIEGGHSIQNSIGALRQLHRLGARYMTLTHSDTLSWADAATDEPRSGGLSEFGEDVVREMNRLGMLVDISHVSVDTMRDALRVSTAPVIASHSSARAVADHPRNVPDDVLRLIAKRDGVVMVNFFSGFVVPESAALRKDMFEVRRKLRAELADRAKADAAYDRWLDEHPIVRGTIKNVVDHIDHIVKVAGIDHVGLGSDFDGVAMTPVGLEDVSSFPNITQELLNRGYSAEQIQKILGLNTLRVLRRAGEVAAREATSHAKPKGE
ncbi:MAG TPA: dipeptidase [Pirellulales bacterium]|nr:dipeptidase [Pirellulales bacterium]